MPIKNHGSAWFHSQTAAKYDRDLEGHDKEVSLRTHYLLQFVMGEMLLRRNSDLAFYPNAPIEHSTFFDLARCGLAAVKNLELPEKPDFLDVGCGLGQALLLAEACGFNPHGLDRCKRYTQMAKRLMASYPDDRVYLADARKFRRYGEFPVIYWFNPIRNRKMMFDVENKIADEAPTPAVLLSGHDNHYFVNRHDLLRIARKKGAVYLKCPKEDWGRLKKVLS